MKKLDLIKLPFSKNNPITVQVLGICSCLAVTAQLKPAVVMAISVTVVVALANLIISLKGNGLWGPIWGYMALDYNGTVLGAVFDHQGETPGLGAEIATDKFANRFIGKQMDEHPIVLKKNADKNNTYEVDAISGSTMTCNGVTEMLEKAFNQYRTITFSESKTEDEQ